MPEYFITCDFRYDISDDNSTFKQITNTCSVGDFTKEGMQFFLTKSGIEKSEWFNFYRIEGNPYFEDRDARYDHESSLRAFDGVLHDLEAALRHIQKTTRMKDWELNGLREIFVEMMRCQHVAELTRKTLSIETAKPFVVPPAIVDKRFTEPIEAPPIFIASSEMSALEAYNASKPLEPPETFPVKDDAVLAAIEALPSKIGVEMQDALGKYNDPPDENDFYYAERLKRIYPKLTYEEIAARVSERFPDSKYQAGEGENLRKALKPPKATPKKKSKKRKKTGNL